MNIHITSDLHFQHKNIIRYANRPYSSYEEMEEALIDNWNKKVAPEDKIYIIGDFGFGDFKILKSIVSRLNGYKIIILGNHDKSSKIMQDMGFDEAHVSLEIMIKDRKVLLSHYPFVEKEFAKLADKRPHMFKYRTKDQEIMDYEGKYTLEELNEAKEDYHKGKAVLAKYSRFPYGIDNRTDIGKKLDETINRLARKFISNHAVNHGQVLFHGHTHSDVKRYLNMINACVEAWDYFPFSEDQAYEQILAWEHELYEKQFIVNEMNYNDERMADTIDSLRNIIQEKYQNARTNKEPEEFVEKLKKRRDELAHAEFMINLIDSHKERGSDYRVQVPGMISQEYLDYCYKNKLFVAKDKLVKGSYYKGNCRNADEAIWTGTVFVYARSKFGSTFLEKINTVEDDNGFDLFVPYNKIEEPSAILVDLLKGSEYEC